MSKKPKLDIRTMIREGKISSDRAGQLIALDNYAGDVLTDSDERALRETVKDNQRMNYYIGGSNRLNRVEAVLMMMMTEIDRDINWIAWALSAIKFTTVLDNTIPAVQIVTQEKYDKIPEEKHTRRTARTYNLMTLYRAVLEDIIQNRRKEYKAIVDGLEQTAKEGREGQYLIDAKTNEERHLLYGMDLIDNADEFYLGWTTYNDHADYTLADLAEDLPELHAAIMDELRRLHIDKQLSIDPDSVELNAYKDTALAGSELDKMDIERIKQWMTAVEGTPLDDYDNLDTTQHSRDLFGQEVVSSELEDAAVRSKHQKYAILQNVGERDVTADGIYKMGFIQRLAYGPMFGYSATADKRHTDTDKDLLERMTRARRTIIYNAKILTILLAWRERAGQLLGLNKSDEWQGRSSQLDLLRRYEMYESYRLLYQLDDIKAYIADRGARDYVEAVQEATAPLYDAVPLEGLATHEMEQEERSKVLQSHHPSKEMMADWMGQDKRIQKGRQLIEDMDLTSINSVSDKLLDIQRDIITEAASDE